MTSARLRPAPVEDPRPFIHDPDVIKRALSGVEPMIDKWCGNANTMPAIVRALPPAFEDGAGDPYRVARILHDAGIVTPDYKLVRIFAEITARLTWALRVETGAWAIRSGMRFPGYEDDLLEFCIPAISVIATGKVVVIDKPMATARVQRPSTGDILLVTAEDVIANMTQGIRAVERT